MRRPVAAGARKAVAGSAPPGSTVWQQFKHGYDRNPRLFYGALFMGVYLLIVGWCFAYFWPLYTGERITYASWFAHMWLGGRWI